MASTPKTSLIGRGIVGGMVAGRGADAATVTPSGPSKTSLVGFGLVGFLVVGLGGAPASPPPAGNTGGTGASAAQSGTAEVVVTTNVRVTQEVVEAVVELQPNVRVTQEVVEVVVLSGTDGGTVASASQSGTASVAPTNVRVTQEVVEAVVEPQPNVRVTQEVVEIVVVPGTVGDTTASAQQNGTATLEEIISWRVETDPRVFWVGTAVPFGWEVKTAPQVLWDADTFDTRLRWVIHTAPIVLWKVGPGTSSTACMSADYETPEPEPPADPAAIGNVAY